MQPTVGAWQAVLLQVDKDAKKTRNESAAGVGERHTIAPSGAFVLVLSAECDYMRLILRVLCVIVASLVGVHIVHSFVALSRASPVFWMCLYGLKVEGARAAELVKHRISWKLAWQTVAPVVPPPSISLDQLECWTKKFMHISCQQNLVCHILLRAK